MKKKVKLFTTIASLCLAVALMAFGVYAATQVNVTISGSVAFTADAHVKAEVTLIASQENITSATLKTYDEAQQVYKTNTADLGLKANETGSFALGDIDDIKPTVAGSEMVYTYTVTVKNLAAATDQFKVLNVALVFNGAASSDATIVKDGYTLTITGELSNGGKLAVGESKTYTVKLTIDSARSLEKKDIGTVLTLTASEE